VLSAKSEYPLHLPLCNPRFPKNNKYFRQDYRIFRIFFAFPEERQKVSTLFGELIGLIAARV
jgi:hypothetical protein